MKNSFSGFTLVEISIVLIIVGLIVAGVMVGQDLIQAAAVQSQVSQIQKFNTATNAFIGKYDGVPGDLKNGGKFGFPVTGGVSGQGDGNGLVEGYTPGYSGYTDHNGESLVFWTDLALSELISETTTSSIYTTDARFVAANLLYPTSKINKMVYVTVWSKNGKNYFSLHSCNSGTGGACNSNVNNNMQMITTSQAYGIDSKLDDGLPTSGRVSARVTWWPVDCWTVDKTASGSPRVPNVNLTTVAYPANTTSCFDNNNTAGATMEYSQASNPNEGSCGLSIKLQ